MVIRAWSAVPGLIDAPSVANTADIVSTSHPSRLSASIPMKLARRLASGEGRASRMNRIVEQASTTLRIASGSIRCTLSRTTIGASSILICLLRYLSASTPADEGSKCRVVGGARQKACQEFACKGIGNCASGQVADVKIDRGGRAELCMPRRPRGFSCARKADNQSRASVAE